MRITRDELHRLVDEVPPEELEQVGEYLRHLVGHRRGSGQARPRRAFRFAGLGQAPPGTGGQAEEIARDELGGRGSTAE
ncbi:hypothetical protein [Saccharopolyspora sp. CA-218241]|uniref:hypothetical protein n=1 Tax=Saccharopolyspora sp. CA-218241 TaxID=3240027 RepID=UPI003D9810E6